MIRHVNITDMQPPIFIRDGERQYYDDGEFIPTKLCKCGGFYKPTCPVSTHRVKWRTESLAGIVA